METLQRNPFTGSSSCNSVNQHPTVRKFINSAIYVEKPLTATLSDESTSLSNKYSSEDLESLLVVKTKRCTCSTNQRNCPCHIYTDDMDSPREQERPVTITKSQSQVQKTVKISKKTAAKPAVELKKTTAILNQKKPVIDKKIRMKTAQQERNKSTTDIEKELLLEQERQNFKNWLESKKKAEIEQKKKKQKEEEEKQLKALEKEKRQLENQLNFQLWLKKKEEAHLEKRIKEQIDMIGELEKKEETIKNNEKAFTDWLKGAKNKQKPTPLNKGIESLCSSSSVTYVNPTPWNTSGTN